MAITAFSMPGPSTATSASARISLGKARKISVIRIRMVSVQPPKYPATVPINSPNTGAVSTTSTTI